MYSKWSYLIKNETQMCTKGARNTEVCCQSKAVLQKNVKKKCTQAVDCAKLVVFKYFTTESIYRMVLIIEFHFEMSKTFSNAKYPWVRLLLMSTFLSMQKYASFFYPFNRTDIELRFLKLCIVVYYSKKPFLIDPKELSISVIHPLGK